MVFSRVHPFAESQFPLGALSYRQGEQYFALLVIEGVYASFVALANIVVVAVLIAGRKKLFENDYYIVVANNLVCTSMKAFVECAFVLPYYSIQRFFNLFAPNRVFTEWYEFLIFNLSVLADYGTLFFTLLIALNRLVVVAFLDFNLSRKTVAISCAITWLISLCFPVIFFIFKCQYMYSSENIYYNRCQDITKTAQIVLGIAVNCSYAVAIVVLALSTALFIELRCIKRGSAADPSNSGLADAEGNLLLQSFVVFVLYSITIAISLSTEFMDTGPAANVFLVIYLANFMNLAIAGVFPLCILIMSGAMKSVLFSTLGNCCIQPNRSAPRAAADMTFTI